MVATPTAEPSAPGNPWPGPAGREGMTILRKTAYIVTSLGLLAGTMRNTGPQLLAARCVTGAFGGVHGALALAIVADVWPPEHRGRATGMLMSAFAVASIAGVPLGIVLGTRFGWQAPFLSLAALGLPLVALAAWVLAARIRAVA